MATTYDIGDEIRAHGKFSTSTAAADLGNYIDPTLVTFKMDKPDGSSTSDTLATGTTSSTLIKRLSTGEFYVDIITTAAPIYEWRWSSTGNIDTSQEDWFSVRDRRVT